MMVQAGRVMAKVVRKLMRSPAPDVEDKNLATVEDIDNFYRCLLHRRPDPNGLAHWTRLVQSKQLTLRDLWNGFSASPEFKELHHRQFPAGAGGENISCIKTEGFHIFLDDGDCLVSAGIAARSYEPHVTAALRLLLNPGAVFLDLGANIGYFTLLAASRVGATGRVLAFEPRTDNVALMKRSIKENAFTNVTVHSLAVAEEELEFMVYPSDTSSLSHVVEAGRPVDQRGYSVRAVALDHFLADLPRLDIIKADIDGNEVRAFRGMRALIQRHRPVIVFEFAPALLTEMSRVAPEVLLEEVLAHGYDIFVLGPGRNHKRGPQDVQGILNAYDQLGSTHVDLVAYPKSQIAEL